MARYSSYVLYLLVAVSIVILYANGFGPMESMQRSLNDALCRLTAPEGVRPNVSLIMVDGRAQDSLGSWPWNYDLIADLTAAVASGNPKAIVLDFDLPEDATQDSAGFTDILADQLSWIDNAILPYDIALATYRSGKTSNPPYLFNNSITTDNPLGVLSEESSLLARKIFLPAEKLLTHKPYIGFDYESPDGDHLLRRHSLVMNYEGFYYPSQSLLAAAVSLGIPPDQVQVVEKEAILLGRQRTIPIDDASRYFIRFARGTPFERYSAADVLTGKFDFTKLAGKTVLVGVDEPRFTETFRTPFREDTPTLWVKATVIENILNKNMVTVREERALVDAFILVILGVLCAFVLPRLALMYRMVALGTSVILLANVNYFMVSSFGIIPQTVYVALELFLFMAAAPLLDSRFITGETRAKAGPPKASVPIAAAGQPRTTREDIPVRQIRDSAYDSARMETRAIDPHKPITPHGLPDDYQTINIDEEVTEVQQTTVTPATTGSAATVSPDIAGSGSVEDEQDYVAPDGFQIDESGETAMEPEGPDSRKVGVPTDPGEVKHLGRYQVHSVLGKGAMGLVYKGIDPAINRPVALKTIRLDFVNDPEEMAELRERLFREAQAAGKLSNPNIVTIYDVGSEGHLQYIAMEYLEGHTLEEMIKKKVKFNYRIIAQIITQICNALHYAHEQGIVHRDIKPANIMILKDYRVKVMDYGIARIDSNSMTKTGIAMGTPNYISPEQLKGKTIDRRADIFSLGVVMYEMLLGRRPFRGENITSLIYAILHHEPEKPSNVNPQIPLLFDHITAKALKKEPAERYQKASEINVDLHDFVESFAAR
ncbi:MAG TPA: serine/threonine-protein kinase [Acidobacteriota bacterium]|nr:serine/threonine-protein kinase [Acidobacteriota bacterium]